MESATTSRLQIVGKNRSWDVPLKPVGVVLGRDPSCGVVLESDHVSRNHARLFRDPFGRWIVEDLHSRNGVWLRDQRVAITALQPGERFRIGPFQLTLAADLSDAVSPQTTSPLGTAILIENTPSEVVMTGDVLACHSAGGSAPGDRSGWRLSRRVLETVRETGQPVLASNRSAARAEQMSLTLADEGRPRTVLCAPLTDRGRALDAL